MSITSEFYCVSTGMPGTITEYARRAEAEGWDGMLVPDSQNLTGDPYVNLMNAANATTVLKVAPGVTNPVTRHPAVTATAISTIQVESGGRAVLGIGRGDSALAHLNLAPAPVSVFEHYLTRLQGYLRGESVPFETDLDSTGVIREVSSLGMADAPTSSSLRWMKHLSIDKVDVDAVATGPRVITTAAKIADNVIFAVGGARERVDWAVSLANESAAAAGRSAGDLGFGTLIPVAVHPDRDMAHKLVSNGLASAARFSVMHGKVVGPVTPEVEAALLRIHANYDMNTHARRGRHSEELTPEIIDTFGIAGPPEYVVERLQSLQDAGLRRFWIFEPNHYGVDESLLADCHRWLVDDVLPKLR